MIITTFGTPVVFGRIVNVKGSDLSGFTGIAVSFKVDLGPEVLCGDDVLDLDLRVLLDGDAGDFDLLRDRDVLGRLELVHHQAWRP